MAANKAILGKILVVSKRTVFLANLLNPNGDDSLRIGLCSNSIHEKKSMNGRNMKQKRNSIKKIKLDQEIEFKAIKNYLFFKF